MNKILIVYFKFHGDILGNQNQSSFKRSKIQENPELHNILNLSRRHTS